MIEDSDPNAKIPMKIFVRNSKKDNIDHQELFRVLKEGIKFYEEYLGVKYPW